MFGIFKKREVDNNIYSPVEGFCLDIEDCSDPVFSSKMLGDGVIVKPTSNVVKAVCDGTIETIFPTKHAIGIKMENGQSVLIHIGLDTVKLKGEGFKQLIENHKKVKKGTPLVEIDLEYLTKKNIDTSIVVVLTNSIDKSYTKNNLNQEVGISSKIIKRE